MPQPNKRMKIETVGLDKAMQPDQWPENKRLIIGETLARMLKRELQLGRDTKATET